MTVALMLILSVVGCAENRRGLGGAAGDHNVFAGDPVAGNVLLNSDFPH